MIQKKIVMLLEINFASINESFIKSRKNLNK